MSELNKNANIKNGFFNLRSDFKDLEASIAQKRSKESYTTEEKNFVEAFSSTESSLLGSRYHDMKSIFTPLLEAIKTQLNNPRVINRRTLTIFLLNNIDTFASAINNGVLGNVPKYSNPDFSLSPDVINKNIGNIEKATRAASAIALTRILIPRIISELSILGYDIDASDEKVNVDDFISQSASHAEWTLAVGASAKKMKLAEEAAMIELISSFRTPITPIYVDKDGTVIDGDLPSVMFPQLRRQHSSYSNVLNRNYEQKPDIKLVKIWINSYNNSKSSKASGITKGAALLSRLEAIEAIFAEMDVVALYNSQTESLIEKESKGNASPSKAEKEEYGKEHALFQEYHAVHAELTEFYWSEIAGNMWFKAIGLKWKKVVSKVETNYVVDSITAATAELTTSSRQTFAPLDFFFHVEHEVRKYGQILNKSFVEEIQNFTPSRNDISDAFKIYSQPKSKVLLCDGALIANGTHTELVENQTLSYKTTLPFAEHTKYNEVLSYGDIGVVFKANNTMTPLVVGHISASSIINSISTLGENKDRDQMDITIDLSLENVFSAGYPVYNGSLPEPTPYRMLDANSFGQTSMYQIERISEVRSLVRNLTDLTGLRTTTFLTNEVTWFDEIYSIRSSNTEVSQLISDYMFYPLFAGVEYIKPKLVPSFTTNVKVKKINRTAMAARLENGISEFNIPLDIIQTIQRWDKTGTLLGDISINHMKFEKRYISEMVDSTINAYVDDQMQWIDEVASLKSLQKAVTLFSGNEIHPTTATLAAYEMVVRTTSKVANPWVKLIVMSKLLDRINISITRLELTTEPVDQTKAGQQSLGLDDDGDASNK